MSAGTPAGFFWTQMRSMSLPLSLRSPWIVPAVVTGHLGFWAILSVAAADGKPPSHRTGRVTEKLAARKGKGGPVFYQLFGLAVVGVAAFNVRLGLGGLGDRLRFGRFSAVGRRWLVGALRDRVRMLGGRLVRVVGPRPRRPFGSDMRFLSAMLCRGLFFGGIGRNRRNQRRPGAGRSGIDGDRFGGRGRCRQQLRRLQGRPLAAGRKEGERRRAARGAVADRRVFVFVTRRLVPFAAAHLVAQVRWRGIDRHEIIHGAK